QQARDGERVDPHRRRRGPLHADTANDHGRHHAGALIEKVSSHPVWHCAISKAICPKADLPAEQLRLSTRAKTTSDSAKYSPSPRPSPTGMCLAALRADAVKCRRRLEIGRAHV